MPRPCAGRRLCPLCWKIIGRPFLELHFQDHSARRGRQPGGSRLGRRGHSRGTIMNIPATGHKVEVQGVAILDVEDGLIVARSIHLGHGRHAPSHGPAACT